MSVETDVIEAEAVEVNGHELEARPVEPTQSNLALFGTSDPVEVVQEATRVADALADAIRAKGLFNMIQNKAHIRVQGWQLLGSMLGVTAVCTEVEPVDGGFMATVEARAADGRVIGRATSVCTKHEKRGPWKSADDYARLSMAQTRATSKALKGPLGFVVSLAGYETTPAEEMTHTEQQAGEPEPVEAEPILCEADVDALVDAIKASKGSVGYERLVHIFGSVGAEAPKLKRADSIRKALAAMTEDQAGEFSTLLTREVQRAGEGS